MKSVTATIGWTKSDRASGYSSYDGYEVGASQHTETVTFEVPDHFTDDNVCWLLLEVTNSPYITSATEGFKGEAYAAIKRTGYNGSGAHWSLSKGDTVTIGETMRTFTGYAVEIVKDWEVQSA